MFAYRSTTIVGLFLFVVIPFSLSYAENQKREADSKISEQTLTQEAQDLLDQWHGRRQILDDAAQKLSLALKKNPNYAPAHMQVGRLHVMGGYYHSSYFEPSSLQAAERSTLKAIELDPKFADAYVLLGHIYINMKRLPDAKNALAKAKGLGATTAWLAINWADIYEREGKIDDAALQYMKVIESGTKEKKALSVAYDELRLFYIRKGNLAKAEELYQQHIAFDPKNAWIRGNYAENILFHIGDFDKSIEKAREALASWITATRGKP